MEVNFYIQRDGETQVDIESTYNMRVTHVDGLHPADYKEVFKRDWAEEDGVDVYFPTTRKTKSRNVDMTVFMNESTCLTDYENFVTFVSEKKFEYWDTLRNKEVSLIYEGICEPEWISYTGKALQFKITFLNYTGRYESI